MLGSNLPARTLRTCASKLSPSFTNKQCTWNLRTMRHWSACSNHLHVFKTHALGFPRWPRLHQVSFRQSSGQAKQMPFARKLQIATYISCSIGVCMLSAVGWREYQRFTRRARGAIAIKDRNISSRAISYKYRGYIIPAFMVDNLDAVNRFKVKEDDIWVVTFPKAGTTWVQEIVYLIATDLDFDKAQKNIIEDRFPYLEFVNPGVKVVDKMESPRFIKTHLPPSLLPSDFHVKKPKMIYLARNPKDTIVSYYYFTKILTLTTYRGDLNTFFNQFLDDTMVYGPWWKHVKEGWDLRHRDNVLFLTYEDLHRDLTDCIHRIANFLEKPLSEREVKAIADHVTFAKMKANPSLNYSWWNGWAVKEGCENTFFRKGVVGDWENHLTPEQGKQIDDLVAEKLKDTELTFQDKPVTAHA